MEKDYKYCINCGHKDPSIAKFCSKCGMPFDDEPLFENENKDVSEPSAPIYVDAIDDDFIDDTSSASGYEEDADSLDKKKVIFALIGLAFLGILVGALLAGILGRDSGTPGIQADNESLTYAEQQEESMSEAVDKETVAETEIETETETQTDTESETDTETESEPETERETEVLERTYIFPDSSTRYLTQADITGLSKKEINYAMNEIYARKGRIFIGTEYIAYFNSKDWYNGVIPADQFTDSMLNGYEKANVEFLVANGAHDYVPK